jgi:hypothetical protein
MSWPPNWIDPLYPNLPERLETLVKPWHAWQCVGVGGTSSQQKVVKQTSKATSIHSVSFKITENGLNLARHGRLDFFGLGK